MTAKLSVPVYDMLAELVAWVNDRTELDTSTVAPRTRDGEHVTVSLEGGVSGDGIWQALVTVQTWADDEATAYMDCVAIQALALIHDWPEHVTSMQVATSPYRFPDADGHPRYQMVLQVTAPVTL